MGAGTAAAYATQAVARGTITSSKVHITLESTGSTAETEVTFPQQGIVPGTAVDTEVAVFNHDAQSWIRIKTQSRIIDPAGHPLPTDVMTFFVDDADWLYRDGWYYCRHSIAPGEATPALFRQVQFSPAMDNRYRNATAVLTLQAQAVQAAHNDGPVETVLGWPAD